MRPPPTDLDLASLPGHQIRRLQQIAVALFMAQTAGHDLTPVQFAALAEVARQPGIDQRTLARAVGFDTSTLGGVVDRLERRQLMRRNADADDRRVRRLTLTPAGRALLAAATPLMLQAQQRLLAPLAAEERRRFMALLDTLLEGHHGASRSSGAAG